MRSTRTAVAGLPRGTRGSKAPKASPRVTWGHPHIRWVGSPTAERRDGLPALQSSFSLFPFWDQSLKKAEKGGVVVRIDQMAQLVGYDIVDALEGSFQKFRVEGNSA